MSQNWVSTGSDNGLSPLRRQAITWTNAALLSIGLLGTNFNEIWIRILSFSFKKMHLKMPSANMVATLSRGRWVKSVCEYEISRNFWSPSGPSMEEGQYCVVCWANVLCAFDNISFCWCDISYDGKGLGSPNGPSRWIFRSPSWFIGRLLIFYTLLSCNGFHDYFFIYDH